MVVGKPPAIDVTGLSPSLSPASGAIVSTADDVVDFYRALLSGRLLRADLLKAMKTTITEGTHVDIPGQRYGLGLELFPTFCGNALGHNGIELRCGAVGVWASRCRCHPIYPWTLRSAPPVRVEGRPRLHQWRRRGRRPSRCRLP